MGLHSLSPTFVELLGVQPEVLLDLPELLQSVVELRRYALSRCAKLLHVRLHLLAEVVDLVGSLGVDSAQLSKE